MKKAIYALTLAISLFLGGCAGVTITENGPANFHYRPHYEESKHFFLWGLIGDHRVDVKSICTIEQPVIQMQSKFTALDLLYGGVTLGLYLPRTAKVWCKREAEAS